jgi:hypothetical protein
VQWPKGHSHGLSLHFVWRAAPWPSPHPSARTDTVINVFRRVVAPRLHAPCENGLPGGPEGNRPSGVPLLLFLDSGILSSVSLQTVGGHTALFKTLRGGPWSPRLGARTRLPGGMQGRLHRCPSPESRHLWPPDALGDSGLPDGGRNHWNLHFLESRGLSLLSSQTEQVWGGETYPKYMNIHHQDLRYWMILYYKLLKCFSAQLVA